MKPLYEIASDLQRLYLKWDAAQSALSELENKVISAEGVTPEEDQEIIGLQMELAIVQGEIDSWTDNFDMKVENVAKLIRNLEAEMELEQAKAVPFQVEANRYNQRSKVLKNRVGWLKEYALHQMQRAEVKKVVGDDLKIQRSVNGVPSITVMNIAEIPSEYLVPQDPRVDKMAIRDAWKAGEIIAGTKVEKGEHIRIR